MKVTKFGGSSLASSTQLRKVLDIVKSDKKRKFIVVSAPGKRDVKDTKVTDALINYHKAYKNGEDLTAHQDWIIARFQAIYDELNLTSPIMELIKSNILDLARLPIEENKFLYDTFLAAGENNNAKLIAAFFTENGLNARYIHPADAGLFVSGEPSNARILPHAYEQINYLNDLDEVLVIPGFFGVTEHNQICTFSRGGSDITGSIIAAGVRAELYENFTDVDGLLAAHPGIIPNPEEVSELTYREMRELAYSGFSVLHDEALMPAYRAQVPLVIKNTNNPDHPGTKIVTERQFKGNRPVVGIASSSDFASINLSKYLLNREVGFGRRVLTVLEDLGVRFEHMPTGIDDISVIVRGRYLSRPIEQSIKQKLSETLHPDTLSIDKKLSIVMVVGEEMQSHIGVTARAATALAEKHINIKMLTQGATEVSLMFIVQEKDEKEAVKALYEAFFN